MKTHTLICLLFLGIKDEGGGFSHASGMGLLALSDCVSFRTGPLEVWMISVSLGSIWTLLPVLSGTTKWYIFTTAVYGSKKRRRKEKRNKMSLAQNVTASTSTSPMPWWAYCQKKELHIRVLTHVFSVCSTTCHIVHWKFSYGESDWGAMLLGYPFGRTMGWASWDFCGFPQTPRKILKM